MTHAQHIAAKEKVLDRVRDLLGEHFEAFLVTVETEMPEEPGTTQTFVHYAGGFNTAWGLAARAVRRLEIEAFRDIEPREE
jgi:hypothetical protein